MGWIKRSKTICPVRDPNGRVVTQRMAQRLFNEQVLDRLETHSINPRSSATVEEFWRTQFEPSLMTLTPRGRAHYDNMMCNHVLPAIGKMRLRDVDLGVLQQVIWAKRPTLATQTLLHIKNTVSALFRCAEELGWYSGMPPTKGLKLPTRMARKERKVLSPPQLQTLLHELRLWSRGDPACVIQARQKGAYVPLWEMALTLALMGLRVGEACGIRWFRLNLGDDFVTSDGVLLPPCHLFVKDNWVLTPRRFRDTPEQVYGELKRETSQRLIPLPGVLVAALRQWQEATACRAPTDPVFAGRTGKPLDHHNYACRVLKPIGEIIGVPWVSWHTFRHTANTVAGSAMVGMTTTDRKKAFGWTEDRMAMHYSHADREAIQQGMERMAAVLVGERGGGVVQ